MKLRKNKNGNGYVTSYTVAIGCKEAREAGFVGDDGEPIELKKTVENGRIIIEIDDSKEPEKQQF